jgi:S1-C subfamily serine protease
MTMRRALLALGAVAALAFTACTTGTTTNTSNPAEPKAVFPSSQATVPTGRDAIVNVVQSVLPAVVNVVSDTANGQGEGTGFVVRSDGIIVTNYHVVENASKITVLTSAQDPTSYNARVIGGDVEADLAILDIDATDLPTVQLGDSAALQLGQRVVALGYALGLDGGPSVTSGIVSSLTRQIDVQDSGCPVEECGTDQTRVYDHVIQTDAAINPGNSGGPLVNMAGQVVGINSAGANGAENIGFAIQIDSAKPTIFQSAENPDAPVAYMGILGPVPVSDPQVQFQVDPPVNEGVLIQDVVPDGPADRAGIQPGDIVVDFDGRTIVNDDDLVSGIRSHKPGDRVEVGIVHADGSQDVVTVTLGVNPVPTS